MKKISAFLLAMTMVFALAACGGGNDAPAPSGGGTTDPGPSQQEPDNDESLEDPSQEEPDSAAFAALAEKYGLTGLSAPAGCTFSEDEANREITLNKSGTFTEDEFSAFAQEVWAVCAELSPDGIYKSAPADDGWAIGDPYSDISETFDSGDTEYAWYYTYNGEMHLVRVDLWPTGSGISIYKTVINAV